jgi:hypothetical protein
MTPMNDDDLQRELECLARSDATSGRRALAKLTAIRTLQRRCPLTTTAASIQAGRSGGTSTAATPKRFGRRGARDLPTEPRRSRLIAKAGVGMPRRLALGRGAPVGGRIESALSAHASDAARQDAKVMDGRRRHHVTASCRQSSRTR